MGCIRGPNGPSVDEHEGIATEINAILDGFLDIMISNLSIYLPTYLPIYLSIYLIYLHTAYMSKRMQIDIYICQPKKTSPNFPRHLSQLCTQTLLGYLGSAMCKWEPQTWDLYGCIMWVWNTSKQYMTGQTDHIICIYIYTYVFIRYFYAWF